MSGCKSIRAAFSLIELVIVLVILGVIAGFAAQSLRGVTARRSLADATDRIRAFDTFLRREALITRRRVIGTIDQSDAVMTIQSSPVQEFALPSRVTIESFWMDPAASVAAASLTAESDGATASYAIKLRCDQSTRWVIVAGGSGQLEVMTDGRMARSLIGNQWSRF